MPRARTLTPLLAALALAPTARAQDRAEVDLNRRCAAILLGFAGKAQRLQVLPRARAAYAEILAHYDADHAAARRALGYERSSAGWKRGAPRPWDDRADHTGRYKVALLWESARLELAALHRARGLALSDREPDAGRRHLLRAIRFDPRDAEAQRRLGHEVLVVGGESYFTSATERRFIETLRALEQRAAALARRDYPVQAVDALPDELAVHDEALFGARSENFLVFAPGTQRHAGDCAKWAERARAFLLHVLGPARAQELGVEARQQWYAWRGFVWTDHALERLLVANRRRDAGAELVKVASTSAARAAGEFFGNLTWTIGGKHRELAVELTPAAMHDRLVSHVWELGVAAGEGTFRPNWPLAIGAVHAAGWLLLATGITKVGGLPEGTAAQRAFELPKGVGWWLRAVRDAAIAGTDMPIRDVARKSSAAFPNEARLKSWSFMTWLMAREPERWMDFVLAVPGDKAPFPEEVDAAAAKVFGRPLDAIEAEWRAWASGQSVTAAATGYAPPLLPEAPDAGQLAGLKRLNELRGAAGLPPCALDLEASLACRDHVRYLARHRDQWSWPAAHEQDPARPGFTPRGMRSGLRSVIAWDVKDPGRAIDEWAGTVYHRFPLLATDIRRVGLAFEGGICVLDTLSLAEPRLAATDDGQPIRRFVRWPADGATGVGRQFAFYELPNPLGDVPPPHNRDDQAGYPVSLTLEPGVQRALTAADIHLFAVKRRGRELVRDGEVALHVHTPFKPLLARQEVRDAVFGIPRAPLAKRTTYQVVVTLRTADATETVEWVFTTGGMGLRRPDRPR